MKKILIFGALALSIFGCGESSSNIPIGPLGSEGKICIAIASKDSLDVVAYGSPTKAIADVSTFGVVIKDSKGGSYASYSSYSEVPQELTLAQGDYTIEARNGEQRSAGFDAPHYYGSTPFRVEVGEVKPVSVQCMLTNVKVTVLYSSKMLAALEDVKVSVVSVYAQGKAGQLPYDINETRAGWFAVPMDKTMAVSVKGVNKSTKEPVTNTINLSGVTARQWRQVTVDVQTSGGAGVTIDIDTMTISSPADNVFIPDSEDVIDNNGDNGNWDEPEEPEEPVGPQAPTIVGASLEGEKFNIDEPVTIVLGDANVLDVEMGSTHEGGLQNLFLTIESAALADLLESVLGITGEIDLANPTEGSIWKGMFEDGSIGLLDPAVPIKGKKKHLFSVGPLMSMLGALPGAIGADHKFHLRVVDGSGETRKTLVISLEGK